jgi:hypothetical protein
MNIGIRIDDKWYHPRSWEEGVKGWRKLPRAVLLFVLLSFRVDRLDLESVPGSGLHIAIVVATQGRTIMSFTK